MITKDMITSKIYEHFKKKFKKKDIQAILETMLDIIVDEVAKGEDVGFNGFGKIYASERCERIGTNPRTKERITIPASRFIKFSAHKRFKSAVNGGILNK